MLRMPDGVTENEVGRRRLGPKMFLEREEQSEGSIRSLLKRWTLMF